MRRAADARVRNRMAARSLGRDDALRGAVRVGRAPPALATAWVVRRRQADVTPGSSRFGDASILRLSPRAWPLRAAVFIGFARKDAVALGAHGSWHLRRAGRIVDATLEKTAVAATAVSKASGHRRCRVAIFVRRARRRAKAIVVRADAIINLRSARGKQADADDEDATHASHARRSAARMPCGFSRPPEATGGMGHEALFADGTLRHAR